MAVGDVVSDLVDVPASGGTDDFQPASGVEVMITNFSSEDSAAANIILRFIDGTLTSSLFTQANIVLGENTKPQKMFINNSIFYRSIKSNAGNAEIGFMGIQTK